MSFLGETLGAEQHPGNFPRNTPTNPNDHNQLGFLREIPSKISLQNTRVLAWLIPQQGHLRGVKIPDLEIWIPFSKYKHSIEDTTQTVSDDYEPDVGSDNRNDWSDEDKDNENNDASQDAQNSNQISDTN